MTVDTASQSFQKLHVVCVSPCPVFGFVVRRREPFHGSNSWVGTLWRGSRLQGSPGEVAAATSIRSSMSFGALQACREHNPTECKTRNGRAEGPSLQHVQEPATAVSAEPPRANVEEAGQKLEPPEAHVPCILAQLQPRRLKNLRPSLFTLSPSAVGLRPPASGLRLPAPTSGMSQLFMLEQEKGHDRQKQQRAERKVTRRGNLVAFKQLQDEEQSNKTNGEGKGQQT